MPDPTRVTEPVETIPYVPIASTARVGVATSSSLDRVTFGVTADEDAAADVDLPARGIADGPAELVVRGTTAARP